MNIKNMDREEFLRTYIKYRRFVRHDKKCIIPQLDKDGTQIENEIQDQFNDIDKKIEKKKQMNIFQTWKTHKIPKVALTPVLTWKHMVKDWNYKLYDDRECLNFIRENFNDKILNIYKALPFGVMKADFWRYCVIYKKGGLYTDLDTTCLVSPTRWVPEDAEFVISGELRTPLFCQWTFYSKKDNPIMKKIIDVVCSRIMRGNLHDIKASMIHNYTGPQAFTAGIVTAIKELAFKENKQHLIPYITSNFLKKNNNKELKDMLKKNKIYILRNGVFDGLYVEHHYGGSRWNYVGYVPWKQQLKSIIRKKNNMYKR